MKCAIAYGNEAKTTKRGYKIYFQRDDKREKRVIMWDGQVGGRKYNR